MENPIKMDDLGISLLLEIPIWRDLKMDGEIFLENPMNKWMIWGVKTPIFGNTHIGPNCQRVLWKKITFLRLAKYSLPPPEI